MQVESLKLMLSERDKENKSLRGEMNDQEVYQLKHEIRELKDLLSNNKGEPGVARPLTAAEASVPPSWLPRQCRHGVSCWRPAGCRRRLLPTPSWGWWQSPTPAARLRVLSSAAAARGLRLGCLADVLAAC